MLGIPLGLLYANAVESMFHRYVLHGLGKKPGSFWAFHWSEHHRDSRRNGFSDEHYRTRSLFGWHPQTKERLAIAVGIALHAPLLPVAPFFVASITYWGVRFYRTHKRAHLDPAWARENVPWHYDHHMGPDQDKNWGIGFPIYDYIAGTREPYVGTEREARDADRRGRVGPLAISAPAV
ncbi:MAG: sterol desaturase family protein [Polyangiaceae bacterium]